MKMDQPVQTNNVVPNQTISTKVVTPRMILGPQVIGARPGQPGVFEYTSEFSEFLKKSAHATSRAAVASPSSSTTDDAKIDDVAQSQEPNLSSPAVPSSTVFNPYNQSVNLIEASHESPPAPTSPKVIQTSSLSTGSISRSEVGSESLKRYEEQASEIPVLFVATHADIMIFPKMTSTTCSSPVSEPDRDKESECVEGNLDARESESLNENPKDENKPDEICDRSLMLQPSESASLVPFEEQLANQNPSPHLQLISRGPDPDAVLRNVPNHAFRESLVYGDISSQRLEPAMEFSPKSCQGIENSTDTPLLSFSHQTPQLSPVLEPPLPQPHQEIQSQLQIQILPHPEPLSTKPIGGQGFIPKTDIPVNMYGAPGVNFSPVTSSADFNYNHLLSLSPQAMMVGQSQSQPTEVQLPPFTSDPGLHSQFLEYAETHPLGQIPPKIVNKSPNYSPVIPSHGTYFRQGRNSISNQGQGGHQTPASPLNQFAGTKFPEVRPIYPVQYNSSFSPSSATFMTPLPDALNQHSATRQPRHLNIPEYGSHQFDYHKNQTYRPVLGQQMSPQLSPRLKSPTSPHQLRVVAASSWIPAQHPRPQGQLMLGLTQASILPSSHVEVQNRATMDHNRSTQLQVQIRPPHGESYYPPASNSLSKSLSYAPPTSATYPHGKYPPPPPPSQFTYHASHGIPSHSTVVGQIPPILGNGHGGSRPSHPHHQSSSFIAHESSYAQHPSQFPRGLVDFGQRGSSGYFGETNQTRYSLGSESSHGTYPSGFAQPPVVCRVSPIRSRLGTNGQDHVRGYHHPPDPGFPKNPFTPPPSRMPSSFSDQRLSFEASLLNSHPTQGYDSYTSYSCQYDDAMRRLSTQFTLQALPGLPPGSQGHHLLVKTENGQYQLLRVGPPPTSTAPTTATTGTPTVPPTTSSSSPGLGGSNSTSVVVQLPLPPALPQTTTTVASTTPTPTTSSTTKTTFVVMSAPTGGAVVASSNVLTNTTTALRPTQPTSVPVIITPTSSMTTSSSITNHSSNSSILSPNVSNRLQTPSVPSAPVSSSPSGVGLTASMSMQHQMHPHPVVLPPQPQALPSHLPSPVLTSITASTTFAATATTVSQMTPETAKQKCKNFLSFLLELSAKQNQTVARNVRGLIQGLVDGKVNAEDFSDRLQREVNSQPQPCLVGFLKKSLPPLRQSLANKELTIEGIRPPPLSSLTTIVPPTQTIFAPQTRPPLTGPATPVRIIAPINTTSGVYPYASPVIPTTTPIPRSTATAVQQRFAVSPKSSPKSKAAKTEKAEGSPSTPKSFASKGKDKVDKKSFASSGTFGGDDDINDVAAMGGVNLAEESQRILGSTELIGTQIRSCQDEPFIKGASLQAKIKTLAASHGFDEPPPEVAVMISHAAEEHIKTMLEKLGLIAEHRLDVIKLDERYEVTQDVKGQLRFLEELEKLERKRHDEQEREMLIKAAKSRSKSEDPEQAKLKAKAKEMQRVAQEELRQREANLTALQAIGPRKKPKLDIPSGSPSTITQNTTVGLGALSNASRPPIPMRPRLKRVSMRDVLFLLESEGETRRSEYLYKQFLK